MIFEQTVVRLRAPITTDRFNNRARDWDAAAREPLDYVNVQRASSSEQTPGGNRDQVVATYWLRTDDGDDLDLLATDRVVLDDGTVCEVVGDPDRRRDPHTGGVHHVEATLQTIRG